MCYYINTGGQSFKIKYMIKIHCTFDKIFTFPPPGFVKHFEASIATAKLEKKKQTTPKANSFCSLYWLQINMHIVRLCLNC